MSEKPIILCDLDGTLADCSHRLHHIQPKPYQEGDGEKMVSEKNWSAFFAASGEDTPVDHMLKLLSAINREQFEVWITSGRSDECRPQTEIWLRTFRVKYDRLIMRKAGDHTDDGILKPSWLSDGTIPKDRVLLAFDDRDRVVKAWRDTGIPCLQVAQGDF